MSVQIDPVHVPLQFLSVQEMQDVRAQETVAPESSLPNETLKLSDYKMSQVPDAPKAGNSEIQERENLRKNDLYYQFREIKEAASKEEAPLKTHTTVDSEGIHIVNVTL